MIKNRAFAVNIFLPQVVEHENSIFMNVFHIFLFLAPNRSHLPVVRYMWLQNGAIFRLWHQK